MDNNGKPHYEIIEWEGEEARFYPGSGAVMKQRPDGRMIIVANKGGNPLMGTEGYAKELQARRWESYYEAVAEGLMKAGDDLKFDGSRSPYNILTEIIRTRAKLATRENRDGNEAAKFIFSVVRQVQHEDRETEENVIKFNLTPEQMENVLGKLFKE